MVETSAALRYFNFESLAATGEIRSVTVNHQFDLTFLLVFFGTLSLWVYIILWIVMPSDEPAKLNTK